MLPLLKVLLSAVLLLGVVINANMVRFGSISSFSAERGDRVGLVDSKEVYRHIEEYKTIQREKIPQGTARYAKLMETCTKKYTASIGKAARTHRLVLIVEVGGISGYPTTPVTQPVIDKLGYIKYDGES